MRRLRKSTRQYIIIVLLSLLVIGAAFVAAYFILLRNIEKSYGIQLDALSNELEANQRYVYEAVSEITAGTCLTEELVVYKQVYTGQAVDTFITDEDFGKVTLVTIPQGVYVQKNMLLNDGIDEAVREAAYECIQLAELVDVNDTIDVRLFYPNGEDYIVLSKKTVKACSEDKTNCYLWLTEEEILLMSSAIVDAYLYSGAYLYSTEYVEPTLQEASIVNYQASLATQELIQKNPNIVTVAATSLSQQLRKSLENRLTESLTSEVETIHWEVSPSEETQSADTQNSQNQEKASAQEEKVEDARYYYYAEEEEAKEKDVEYGE